MRPARLVLVVTTVAALALAALLSAQQSKPAKPMQIEKVFDQLKLADLGWDHTVSTEAFKGGLKG